MRVKAPLAGTRWIGSQPSPAQATVGLLERVAAEEREPGVRPVGLSHFGRIADVVKMSSTLTTE